MKLLNIGAFLLIIGFYSCKMFEGTDDEAKSLSMLALVTQNSNTTCSSKTTTGTKVSNSTATLSSNCVSGVTTCMDSLLPSWIKNNFKCSIGYVSGSTYVFKSQNVPNTKSYYYSKDSSLYEDLPSGNTAAGTNTISSQNIVYYIPSSPSVSTGSVSTQSGDVSIGITVNGLAIFNNAAAPPDTLSTEATTFDKYAGHPQNTGVYHHHTSVPIVCDGTTQSSNSTACNNSTLIGIILDGYAIYGQKCDNGTSDTSDDFTPTDLDSLHGHTAKTIHFSTATYHYHYAYDSTSTLYTLMGSFFYGNKGYVTNN